ncbi:MAG: hypothetical protein JNL67_19855 [Planctomycetaceae bacterium]|nr:hypothetical protein [Planctomycetaceae bacterium]
MATSESSAEKPLTLRAPTTDRQVLFRTRDQTPWAVQPCSQQTPLVDSTGEARRELLRLAQRWTQQYSVVPEAPQPTDSPVPEVFLSGHQPELFHPGVWFKNFVLHEFAKSNAVASVNVLIDQDLVKTNSLLVPTENWRLPTRQRVPIDYGGVGIPFEERQIEHPDVLATVPERVKSVAAPWVSAELLTEIWPDAVELGRELRGLGYGFAAARHLAEQRRGCFNLEVPLSWLCQTSSFAQFVVRILEQLESFVESYNECLATYRIWHGIAGQQRPMPDLAVHEGWYELPFWLWTAQQPWRRRVFVRRVADGWQMSTGRTDIKQATQIHSDVWRLDLDHELAIDQLLGFSELQIRLRPRALMTTLYARAVLSQGFLHGIGGALYDQMTDRLARLVWNIDLPNYAIATATFHLATPPAAWTSERRVQLHQSLRDLSYSPERVPAFARSHPQWMAEKQELLAKMPPPRQRHAWQRQIERHLAGARHELAAEIQATKSELQLLDLQLQKRALMQDREWSFVLFEESVPNELRTLATKLRK